MTERQAASDVLMVRPAGFCGNEQTARSNRFQQSVVFAGDTSQLARTEFDSLKNALVVANVRVISFPEAPGSCTPDAVFPNNWVSFHADGTAVLYPMLALNRRLERRGDILELLATTHGFRLTRVVDLSHRETEGKYLEGTGSLVLDRINHIAYACLSPRTHIDVLSEFAQLLDYEIVSFEASDATGVPVYHTNVLLSVGTRFATVCTDAIRPDQRAAVLSVLRSTHPCLLELSLTQMNEFAGNILELAALDGGQIVALSSRAAAALTCQQRDQLQTHSGPLVTASIPTIETLGGGSVRCMLAEIHLPREAPL
jgi:hypothetical protein